MSYNLQYITTVILCLYATVDKRHREPGQGERRVWHAKEVHQPGLELYCSCCGYMAHILATSLPDTLTYRDLYLWLVYTMITKSSWWSSHCCSGSFQTVTQPDSSAMDKCPEGKWNHSCLRSTVPQLHTHTDTHTRKKKTHLCIFFNYTHSRTLDPLA